MRNRLLLPLSSSSREHVRRLPQPRTFRSGRGAGRDIGPTRAGRARALAGVPNHPNIFYAGFDNGGAWRSTDYAANRVPLFDDQTTGSIGAIAVAPSNPNIIRRHRRRSGEGTSCGDRTTTWR